MLLKTEQNGVFTLMMIILIINILKQVSQFGLIVVSALTNKQTNKHTANTYLLK